MKFNRVDVDAASDMAIAACIPGAEFGHILERTPDGGIVGDRSILEGACLFPVSMVREGHLQPGDWTVIPYVRDPQGESIETESEYYKFTVELV